MEFLVTIMMHSLQTRSKASMEIRQSALMNPPFPSSFGTCYEGYVLTCHEILRINIEGLYLEDLST